VASGIASPTLVTSAPGDASRLYVLTRNGTILLIKNGTLQATPFLDISSLVHQAANGSDERGLLGLAFHPNYASNGRFFVYYTNQNTSNGHTGDQVLAEYARSAIDPDTADIAQGHILFTEDDFEANHNGGTVIFSPVDHYLYVFMGDGGGGGDQHGSFGNGQNLASRYGKALRLDVDSPGTPGSYVAAPGNMSQIPSGNPSTSVLDEIWDYGLRNPFRDSFDPCTGDLYIGDVGQNMYEEIDYEPAGQGGRNYGWRTIEGTHCFNTANFNSPLSSCDTTGVTMPIQEYPHSGGACAVMGGVVYRGSAIPALRGTYLYSDYCSGALLTTSPNGAGGWSTATDISGQFNSSLSSISSLGLDAQGEIYMTTLGGSVFRLDPQ
jgi:glucose/arabinose dehydrogenase